MTPDEYERLQALNAWTGRSDLVGLRHIDEFNQSAGRNLGFRKRGEVRHVLLVNRRLFGLLMGRLIAGHCARLFFPGLSCAGFRVVFAVGTRPLHDGSSRGWDLPRWTTHFAASAVHPIKRDSPAHVPAGTSVGRSRVNALRQDWPQAAPPAVRSKSWPDRSVACIPTASFRATATAARSKPIRSLSLSPHVRSELSAEVRVRMTVAAS